MSSHGINQNQNSKANLSKDRTLKSRSPIKRNRNDS